MKLLTNVVLISSAMCFPLKAKVSIFSESVEVARRKRGNTELVVKGSPCPERGQTRRAAPHGESGEAVVGIAVQPARAPGEEDRQEARCVVKTMRVRLTFYSGKDDRWGSRVAWDQAGRARRGRTVAADPTILPYGTWIAVPGFGKLRVEDTGSAVKTKKASGGREPVIDVYVGDAMEVARIARATPHYVEITLL